MKKILTFAILSTFLFTACSKDDEPGNDFNVPADVQWLYDKVWNQSFTLPSDIGKGDLTVGKTTSFSDNSKPCCELASFTVTSVDKYVTDTEDKVQGEGLLISGSTHKVKIIFRDDVPGKFIAAGYRGGVEIMFLQFDF